MSGLSLQATGVLMSHEGEVYTVCNSHFKANEETLMGFFTPYGPAFGDVSGCGFCMKEKV